MISKSTIAAMVLAAMGLGAMGLASPAFAQAPPTPYTGYPGAYAYPYEAPPPFGWAPDYGGWPNAATIDYNIHTPPNH
jgi:hypothetical protein